MGDGFGQLEVPSCAPHRAGASRARLVRARSRPSWGRQVSPFLRLPGASPHAWMPSVSPFLRLPGASPHAWMPSVSPDDLMFGPTFSDFLPLVRRRFGGSGTRMDVRSAVLVGSFRAARLPARYNFSRDPRWISVDLIGVSLCVANRASSWCFCRTIVAFAVGTGSLHGVVATRSPLLRCWCILVHPVPFLCVPGGSVHSGVFWCILRCSGAFWCIRVHSGAFCCILVNF